MYYFTFLWEYYFFIHPNENINIRKHDIKGNYNIPKNQ